MFTQAGNVAYIMFVVKNAVCHSKRNFKEKKHS